MSADAINPLEAVLRLIAAAAPQPWYPRVYAQQTKVSPDLLNNIVEHLWLDGLLQKGPGTPETGGGLLLSPAGEELLRDPDALHRLREGDPVQSNDRGGVIRSVFRKPPQAGLTRLLLWANVLWFGYGLYLAHTRHNAARDYLGALQGVTPAVATVLHQIGDAAPEDLVRGEWWRLLTCCFVHFGFLHVAMNMYGLHVIGRDSEQMWGRWRYLAIYLLSGFGGSCCALAFRPTLLAGASGALCGILGATLAWLLLNGRYLPRRAVRRWRWGIIVNVLLLVGVSSLPNVSALGHFGGMGVGAVAALVLNVQRFGRGIMRVAPLIPLVALPWLGVELVQRQRAVNPLWVEWEERVFYKDFQKRVDDANTTYKEAMAVRNDLPAEKRLSLILKATQTYEAIDTDLARADYRSPDITKERQEIRDGIARELRNLKKREDFLRPLVEKDGAEPRP